MSAKLNAFDLRRVVSAPAPTDAIADLAILQKVMQIPFLFACYKAGILRFATNAADNEIDPSWAWGIGDPAGKVCVWHHLSGPTFESVTTGDLSWPVSITCVPNGNAIALVAGADEYIASSRGWDDPKHSVVAMLSDAPISAEALSIFAGRHVVLADCNPAHRKAFAVWRKQLTGVAARVDRFVGCDGWSFADGKPARGLSDLCAIDWEDVATRGKPAPKSPPLE